jgi:hypothetical protein
VSSNSDPIDACPSFLTLGDFEMEKTPHHFSFLLRMWLAGDDAESQWRVSLEDTHSGERSGFGSLDALNQYLKRLSSETKSQPEEIQPANHLDRSRTDE